MKLRIARKIYNAIGGERDRCYSTTQKQHALNRVEKTASSKDVNEYWHAMMNKLTASDRFELAMSLKLKRLEEMFG